MLVYIRFITLLKRQKCHRFQSLAINKTRFIYSVYYCKPANNISKNFYNYYYK